MRSLSLIALPLLVAPLASQVVLDSFSYPDGPVVPGWTQQRGTWQVRNGRISVTSGSLWAYLTKDGITAQNSVLDGEFFFTGTGVQFAGLTSHHPGGNLDSNLLMVKIQNNGGVADFDRIFSYERPVALGTFFVDIPGGTVDAYCRMITLDTEFWIECDADRDGVFEVVVPPRPITQVVGPGLVGMNCFATSEADNFEYFDAVFVPQVGAVPRVGTTYGLRLTTPTGIAPFLGMLSFGNAGIPLGTRAVPLSLDPLLIASLGSPSAFGLVGVTDPIGKATPGLIIPNILSLVGITLFTSAVTIDPTKPFGIGHISNEQAFTVQP